MRYLLSSLLTLSTLLLLTACYHPTIQQGNIWDAHAEQQLKLGMSRAQVTKILGDSILTNPFNENKMIYVYTNNPSSGDYSERKMILTFKGDKLSHIQKN